MWFPRAPRAVPESYSWSEGAVTNNVSTKGLYRFILPQDNVDLMVERNSAGVSTSYSGPDAASNKQLLAMMNTGNQWILSSASSCDAALYGFKEANRVKITSPDGKCEGIELNGSTNDSTNAFRMRTFLRNGTVTLIATGPSDCLRGLQVERFFGSLKMP